MRLSNRACRTGTCRFFLLLMTSIVSAGAVPTPQANDTAERVLAAARATMEVAGNCFLITLDLEGQPQARLMDPFQPESNMSVWLATNRTTRKVSQIQHDQRVTLAYHDAEGAGYVTLIGHARLFDSSELRHKYWKPDWQPFYPGGPEDDEYLLIQVQPSRIEVMSISRDVAADPVGWRPAVLELEKGVWVLRD